MLKPRASEPSWTILAEHKNDEQEAIEFERSRDWRSKLRCALQNHSIPTESGKALQYYLSFIEFRESGAPYPLKKSQSEDYTPAELAEKINFVDALQNEPIIQLRALSSHLRAHGEHNYVIVWVHGWRHDARIGDGNIRDIRIYAAHVARWLAQRCEAGERVHCDRVVTAVYIGWRGARLDEGRLKYLLKAIASRCKHAPDYYPNPNCWGHSFDEWGEVIAKFATSLTLFDRKPVSEAIAPHVLTTLRSIESALSLDEREKRRSVQNKMIVFGHSLGGNLLMTAVKEDILKRINNHLEGSYYESIIGNLIVLVNPASEAGKWTAIQKVLWHQFPFRVIEEGVHTVKSGRRFFPSYQRPVLISVTSAFAWPPGGLRAEDCAAFERPRGEFRDQSTASDQKLAEKKNDLENLRGAVKEIQGKHESGIKYDEATYELFPLFKGDFRPVADLLLRIADKNSGEWCSESSGKEPWRWLVKLGEFVRDLPFQNTDMEDTRTIGHLDPPRFGQGDLTARWLSAKPFGTTHEIRTTSAGGEKEAPIAYEDIPSRLPRCDSSRYWLSRARAAMAKEDGKYWDSEKLARNDSGGKETQALARSPAVRFFHGPYLAGIEPIARPNDPFWNIRASDDVLSTHDGYMRPSFICAFNQLVIDESTEWPPQIEDSTIYRAQSR